MTGSHGEGVLPTMLFTGLTSQGAMAPPPQIDRSILQQYLNRTENGGILTGGKSVRNPRCDGSSEDQLEHYQPIVADSQAN